MSNSRQIALSSWVSRYSLTTRARGAVFYFRIPKLTSKWTQAQCYLWLQWPTMCCYRMALLGDAPMPLRSRDPGSIVNHLPPPPISLIWFDFHSEGPSTANSIHIPNMEDQADIRFLPTDSLSSSRFRQVPDGQILDTKLSFQRLRLPVQIQNSKLRSGNYGGWRDGQAVRITCFQMEFGSQHPHGGLLQSITSVPGDQCFLLPLQVPGTHKAHIHTCRYLYTWVWQGFSSLCRALIILGFWVWHFSRCSGKLVWARKKQ